MIIGEPADFAVEVYHEPSGPAWGGFGRMCVHLQGVEIGNVKEHHCSLFDAMDRLRRIAANVETLWDECFTEMSNAEVFDLLDKLLYTEKVSGWPRYGRFDFLTNSGEQFDGIKTFILCRPGGQIQILYRLPNDSPSSGSCSVQNFRFVATSISRWFDEQVAQTAPPFLPLNPFDLSDSVSRKLND